ncbi:hypothetical protein E3D14_23495 (plasmid) [Aeromonas salmonicida subsp. salmonicida]|nr:hypothetical protein E3D14_23495 [Aeromonas salmonicida subsp. salmonicida]
MKNALLHQIDTQTVQGLGFLVHTSIEQSRGWCWRLLRFSCQKSAAQWLLRPVNWCSRLLTMTLTV